MPDDAEDAEVQNEVAPEKRALEVPELLVFLELRRARARREGARESTVRARFEKPK